MKLIDNIVNKIGYSNLFHILISALITALCGMFPFPGILVGVVLSLGLGLLKEKLDDKFDMADFRYDLIGTTFSAFIWTLCYIV